MGNPYVPLLIMSVIAILVAIGGLASSAILGPGRKNRVKQESYECGIDPGPVRVADGRFPVMYYLVAMTFIVFDIEVVFMYPWVVSFSAAGIFGFIVMIIFLAIITVPYLYEIFRGGLEWT